MAGLIPLSASGCDHSAEPSVFVGDLPIPESVISSLQEPERQMLADLVGLGAAVARDESDLLGSLLVERFEDDARVAGLPYALGLVRMALDESTLHAAYAQQPEWELSVRHVVRLVDSGAPRAVRDRARGIAGEVAARAAAGENFAELAASFSDEPGAASRGGLLQPGRRGSWVEPFWNAAASLRPGESSGVVETQYGYHVLHLEDRRVVPFEDADRGTLLRWVVPQGLAVQAMEDWANADGLIHLDSSATRLARQHLLAGQAVPDSLVLAVATSGEVYVAASAAGGGWARLPADIRATLEAAPESEFFRWIESEARDVIWAAQAHRLGVQPAHEALRDAEAEWLRRISRWSQAFGFHDGMTAGQVIDAAHQAVLSGAPEVRSARQELRSLRPRLRGLYPFGVRTP